MKWLCMGAAALAFAGEMDYAELGMREAFASLRRNYVSSEAFTVDEKVCTRYSSGTKLPTTNGVMENQFDREIPDDEIKRTVEMFKQRNLPFVWWSSCKNLAKFGLVDGGTVRGITCDLDTYRHDPKKNKHLSILQVGGKQGEKDFCEAFVPYAGDESEEFTRINFLAQEKGEMIHFVAYIHNEPVGCVTLCYSDKCAGIWNLSIKKNYRKKGIATALVYRTMEEAQKLGYKKIMAALDFEEMAWNLFVRIGFKETSQIPFYVGM